MWFRFLPAAVIRLGLSFVADSMVCLRFFTRLPFPTLPFESGDWHPAGFGPALRAAPLAGLAVGFVTALALTICIVLLGLPHLVASTLALIVQLFVTGALHEDGLADVADGFGGGSTKARKLDIMRDSRLGAFGTIALVASIFVRVAAVAALLDRYGLPAAALALPAVAAASRGFALLPLALLPAARPDGLAQAAGPLPPTATATAMGLAVFLGMTLSVFGGLGEARALAACLAGLAASAAVTHLAFRQIGGQTGDVAGAAQQMSEVGFLLVLLVAPGLG